VLCFWDKQRVEKEKKKKKKEEKRRKINSERFYISIHKKK